MDSRTGFPLPQAFGSIVVSDLLAMVCLLVPLPGDTSACHLLAVCLPEGATYPSAPHPVDVVDLLKL